MVKDRFALEQEIMDCWSVCDDMGTLLEGVCDKEISRDDVANALLGMRVMYQLKFEKLFDTFEEMIHTGKM